MSRRCLMPVLVACGVLAGSEEAFGAGVTVNNGPGLHSSETGWSFYASGGGSSPDPVDLAVTLQSGNYRFADPSGVTLYPGTDCSVISATEVSCPAAGRTAFSGLLGSGDDRVTFADGFSVALADMTLGSGADFVQLGSEPDQVDGDGGDDEIRLGGGTDNGRGGPGSDRVHGEAGDDQLMEFFFEDDSPDRLDGGEGQDFLSGGGGDDELIGGPGDDTLAAAPGKDPGNDHVVGGEGDDTLNNRDGDDILDGGPGDDFFNVVLGTDTVIGGEGDDYIVALESGVALVDAGPGDDEVATFSNGDLVDQVACGDGDDRVFPGPGDVVATDCEQPAAELECDQSKCVGTISVIASPTPTRAISTASGVGLEVAKPGKKRKPLVLGEADFKVRGGTSTPPKVAVALKPGKVRKALRGADGIKVTRLVEVQKTKPKKGKKPKTSKQKTPFVLRAG